MVLGDDSCFDRSMAEALEFPSDVDTQSLATTFVSSLLPPDDDDDDLTALPSPLPLSPSPQHSQPPTSPRRRPQSSGAGLDRFFDRARPPLDRHATSAVVEGHEQHPPPRSKNGHSKSLSSVREGIAQKLRSGAGSIREHFNALGQIPSGQASSSQPSNRSRGIRRRSTMEQLSHLGVPSTSPAGPTLKPTAPAPSNLPLRRRGSVHSSLLGAILPSSTPSDPPPSTNEPVQTTTRPPVIPRNPYSGAAARAAVRDLSRQGVQRSLARRDSNLSTQGRDKDRESAISLVERTTEDDSHREAIGKNFVNYLPEELSVLIFSYLDERSLNALKHVSRTSRSIASDPFVWKTLFLQTFNNGASVPPAMSVVGGRGLGKSTKVEQDYEAMYRARMRLGQNWDKGVASAVYLNGHTDSVYCVQFDETKIITGSRDRTIRIWTVDRPHRCLRVIGVPEAYETDRREFRQGVRLDVPEGHTVVTRHADYGPFDSSIYHTPRYYHNASILCLQYDDEIAVTGSSDCSLIVWDIKAWQPVRRLQSHQAGVLDIALDKEKIISCSKDSTICIWDRVTGNLLEQLRGHGGPVNAVQLRGNLFVSASGEGCAKLWNLKIENPGTSEAVSKTSLVRDFWSEDRGLACVEFSEDCKYILAGGNDQVIYKFDTATGAVKSRMAGHESLVRSLYLDTANRRVLSGSYDLSLRVWDYDTGVELLYFPNWATSWMLSAKSDYRRIVSTSQDGRVCVVDFACYRGGSQHDWKILQSDEELQGPGDQLVPAMGLDGSRNDLGNPRSRLVVDRSLGVATPSMPCL